MKSNAFVLEKIAKKHQIDLIFLSEPQDFQCDVKLSLQSLVNSFNFYLNSEDNFDMTLPLTTSKSYGGTMILWRSDLSPCVKVIPPTSPSFISILLKLPGAAESIHTSVYLPTSGKNGEWMVALSELEEHVEEVRRIHNNCPIFLKGDFNASSKNLLRSTILAATMERLSLTKMPLNHNTYHHFTGVNGEFDSDLDQIFFTSSNDAEESLVEILCELQDPFMYSHHDIVVSSTRISFKVANSQSNSVNISAPRATNERFKTLWSDDGIALFQEVAVPQLADIRNQFSSDSDISSLLSSTYAVLQESAKSSNKTVDLSKPKKAKKVETSKEIKKAAKRSLQSKQRLNYLLNLPSAEEQVLLEAKEDLVTARAYFRKLQTCRICRFTNLF